MMQKLTSYDKPLLRYKQKSSFLHFGQSYPGWSKLPRLTVLCRGLPATLKTPTATNIVHPAEQARQNEF